MPWGMKPRRQAAPRPLLPPALCLPAAVLITGCAVVTASLALAFAGQGRADALDAAVDRTIRDSIGYLTSTKISASTARATVACAK